MSDPYRDPPPSKFIQIAITSDPRGTMTIAALDDHGDVWVRAMEGTRPWARISSEPETDAPTRPVEKKWGVVILTPTGGMRWWMQVDSEVWVGTKAEAIARADTANNQRKLEWLRCEARKIG